MGTGRPHRKYPQIVSSALRFSCWFIAAYALWCVLDFLPGSSTIGSAGRRRVLDSLPRIGRVIKPPGASREDVMDKGAVDEEIAQTLRLSHVRPEVLSWNPRIIHLHHFLSDDECDTMMRIGRPQLAVSAVVDVTTGKGIKSQVRTSSGMFLTAADRRRHPEVVDIEKRISYFTWTPVENGELLQILRYEKEQYYKPHYDYFDDEFNIKRGGQRVATVLMYLVDVEDGGETHFPEAGGGASCSCGGERVKGLCVQPRRGDAILFWSQKLDGKTDPKSLHASCPVLKGEKWSCTKWIRQSTFV